MHDIQSKSAPPNLLDLFSQVDSLHSYNTRSATGSKFYINVFKTNHNRAIPFHDVDVKYRMKSRKYFVKKIKFL